MDPLLLGGRHGDRMVHAAAQRCGERYSQWTVGGGAFGQGNADKAVGIRTQWMDKRGRCRNRIYEAFMKDV